MKIKYILVILIFMTLFPMQENFGDTMNRYQEQHKTILT